MNQPGEDLFESQDEFSAAAGEVQGRRRQRSMLSASLDGMDEESESPNEGVDRTVATSRRSISSEPRATRAEIPAAEQRLRSQSAHAEPATIGDVLAQRTRRQHVQNGGSRRQEGAAEVGYEQEAARLLCLENLPDDTLPGGVLARAYRVLGSPANLPQEASSLQVRTRNEQII